MAKSTVVGLWYIDEPFTRHARSRFVFIPYALPEGVEKFYKSNSWLGYGEPGAESVAEQQRQAALQNSYSTPGVCGFCGGPTPCTRQD